MTVTVTPDGSAGNPFIVDSWQTLQKVGTGTDGWGRDRHYRQTANIDMNGRTWTAIGRGGGTSNHFRGSYNGGGYSISKLSLTITDGYQGFFGIIGSGGAVRNVALIDASINVIGLYIGGIAGLNYGTIENCYITGTVTGSSHVGGIVGYNEGAVQNCYATCSVTGIKDIVGGIVGSNLGTVTKCYATGYVGGSNNIGGIVGQNNTSSSVTYCVAMSRTISCTAGMSEAQIGRVIGNPAGGAMNYNYARDIGLTMFWGSTGNLTVHPWAATANGKDGAGATVANTHTSSASLTWWRDTPAFAASDWTYRSSGLPTLRTKTNGVSGSFNDTQNPTVQ